MLKSLQSPYKVDQPLKIQKDKEVCTTSIIVSFTFGDFRRIKTICCVITIAMAIRTAHHGQENMIRRWMMGNFFSLNIFFYYKTYSAVPSEWLRKLEVEMNDAFNQYREMYFEGGVRYIYIEFILRPLYCRALTQL